MWEVCVSDTKKMINKYLKNQKNQSTRFRSADLILILILFLCGLAAFAFIKIYEKPGKTVQVSVDGQIVGDFPLDREREIVITPDSLKEFLSVSSKENEDTSSKENADISSKENADRKHESQGEGESFRNLLVIKDGKASMKEADCPDKICVAHKPICKKGETIVCLPHKVVVEVRGEDHHDDIDAIAR